MRFIEKFSTVFLIAGFCLFFGATLSLGIIPALMVDRINPRQGLPKEVPENFKVYFASAQQYGDALLQGRDAYIAEACWHCHSQFVRPAGNESLRYGPVSTPGEYNTVLHLPQLLGTRRVGPDLSREAGEKSNDWHFAHLWDPQSVVPDSVMPRYTWFFDIDKDTGLPKPNARGIALVAYLQSLGHDVENRHVTQWDHNAITLPPSEDEVVAQDPTGVMSNSSTDKAEDAWK